MRRKVTTIKEPEQTKIKKIGVSEVGVELIKKYEGFSSSSYRCPAGVWTIGYGTTRINGRAVIPGMKITEDRASELLMEDIESHFQSAVKLIDSEKLNLLNQNQIDALSSFVYNVGVGNFSSSTLRKRINSGNFNDVPAQLRRWTRAGGKVLRGLIRRRAEESALWSK